MSQQRKPPSWLDTVPSDFSRVIGKHVLRIVTNSAGTIFGEQTSLAVLAPHFTAVAMDFAQLRNYPMTIVDADKLGVCLANALERLSNSVNFVEMLMARVRFLLPAAIALRLGKNAIVFTVYSRALAHGMLTYRNGSMTVEELVNAILGIGDADQ